VPKTKEVYLPLTIEEYSAERNLPVDYLKDVWDLKEVEREKVVCIEQPYTRLDMFGGAVCCDPRWRFGKGSKPGKKSPVGAKLILYGQKQLPELTPFMFLVEGESDTQTLRYLGWPVLGIPGAKTWSTCIQNDPDVLRILKGCQEILIVREPASNAEKLKNWDSPAKMVADIQTMLPNARALRLWEFAPRDANGLPLYKDVSGLWMHYGGADGKKQVIETLRIVASASNPAAGTGQRKIEIIHASDVEMKLTRWLWPNRVPLNKVTVFSGMAERGKSTVAADFIARLTRGKDFPDTPNANAPCDVMILASEEDYDEDILPRLSAAGADINRIHFAKQSSINGKDTWEIAIDRDWTLLREALTDHKDVRVIVIDPITSYVGNVDPNKPKEVRPFIDKLKVFAKDLNISILLIMHFSKNPDVAALHRSGGAATWTDAPRAVWLFDKKRDESDETVPRTHVMVPGKLNRVAADQKKTLEFTFTGVPVRIEGQDIPVGAVVWGSATDLTIDQQFKSEHHSKPGPQPMKTESARAWLKTYLADGPKPSAEVFSEGDSLGHEQETLRTAKKREGIKSWQRGGCWYWELSGPNPC
jgi:RecA-family ATPase